LTRWRSETVLGEGLRARDFRLESAQVFTPAEGDIPVAEVEGGPVIVARNSKPKQVALGFHPSRSAMRFELATPLLYANVLRWMTPGIFRRWELTAVSVGTVAVPSERPIDAAAARVVDDRQNALPFSVQGSTLRFFSAAPGMVRVALGDRELAYSLSLPDLAEARWEPPKTARRSNRAAFSLQPGSRDLWRWLAILGALGLAAEWLLFGRRVFLRHTTKSPASTKAPLIRRAS
jgi:hypothetical protein